MADAQDFPFGGPIPDHGPMPSYGPKVVPAATLVVFRKAPGGGAPELLMVRRADKMRFAAAAAVFPGGRVDQSDRALAAETIPDEEPELAAAKVAAIRETLEETGLLVGIAGTVNATDAADARTLLVEDGTLKAVLDRFGWLLEPAALTLWAHWCPLLDKAFDTRFFVTDIGTGSVEVEADRTENTHTFWVSAERALALADEERLHVIFPTRRNLERLALFDSHEAALAHLAQMTVRRISPSQQKRDGADWIVIPEDQGYPVCGQPLATAKRG